MTRFVPLLLLLVACASSAARVETRLDVRVEDDERAPVPGAQVLVDGVVVAESDASGRARASVHASALRPASIAVRCPEGHTSPGPRRIPLSQGATVYQLVLLCRPDHRLLPVIVRAPGAVGAWVRADGSPLGRIAADGTLHALLRRVPGSDVRLAIDTAEFPRLVPQHPTRDIHVGDRSELVLFDQAFAVREERPAARRARVRPPSLPRPYAIGPAR